MHLDFIKIKPSRPICSEDDSDEGILRFVESGLRNIIPEEVLVHSTQAQGSPKDTFLLPLEKVLPIVSFDFIHYKENILCAKILSPAKFTQGVGRFFINTLSTSLLPGKIFSFFLTQGLSFEFIVCPETYFFYFQCCVNLENAQNVKAVKKNLDAIANQVRLTVLGVMHSRKLVASKTLSTQEKHMILVENLMSLNPSSHTTSDKLYGTSYDLLSNAYKEQKDPLLQTLPSSNSTASQLFDHNIFDAFYKKTNHIFHESEMKNYPVSYLHKMISYCYLFRKMHKHAILNKKEFADSIKIINFPSKDADTGVNIPKLGAISVLVGESSDPVIEKLALAHYISTFQTPLCLTKLQVLHSPFFGKKITLIYFDIKKPSHAPFSLEEIKRWKTDFLSGLKQEHQNIKNKPSFQSRHPEEMSSFLSMRESYYKHGEKSLVHALFSSGVKRGCLVTFAIITDNNYDQLQLEQSKLRFCEICSHQKEIIGSGKNHKPIYYHSLKTIITQKSGGTPAEDPEEIIEQVVVNLETIFGPLQRFSKYFAKQCPQKLIALKQSLPVSLPQRFTESIYFALTPRSHRLSLKTEHLKQFVLFLYSRIQSLTPSVTLTHVYENYLWVLTKAANMQKTRPVIRKTPSLSITELYTNVDEKQIFAAIIQCNEDKDAHGLIRSIVDNKVQYELSKRLRPKKTLPHSFSV
ncbi:hypothetical protein COB21_03610 [Candidatus Aerophobetes bacterium]|uniref:Uncharacterized protein n=1 Tax=Aerophobetes bacterium TaxID=2030807 RepID=A0A2A4X4H2_UNCAE|nr:MAG: hypothetical protein COB21_03610 [Candidatus Aerophobetes bacterium]